MIILYLIKIILAKQNSYLKEKTLKENFLVKITETLIENCLVKKTEFEFPERTGNEDTHKELSLSF